MWRRRGDIAGREAGAMRVVVRRGVRRGRVCDRRMCPGGQSGTPYCYIGESKGIGRCFVAVVIVAIHKADRTSNAEVCDV